MVGQPLDHGQHRFQARNSQTALAFVRFLGGQPMSQTFMRQVLFLHGFTSSARSGKATFLKEQYAALPNIDFTIFDFNPTPRDFEYLTITGMINRLRQYILDRKSDRVTLIASSLG